MSQMPIVDGLTATKMIRSYEKTHPTHMKSNRASLNGRVPIIAVSASLVEKERQKYTDAGFDGWILKPINFARLNELLTGIVDKELRESCLYRPGNWEQGGWFGMAQPNVYEATTTPSGRIPYVASNKVRKEAADEDEDKVRPGRKTIQSVAEGREAQAS